MDGVHIVGEQATLDKEQIIKLHLAGLLQMVQTHKIAIGGVGAEIAQHLQDCKKSKEPYSVMFVGLLNIQMAIHCAGVTQGTGQLALMAAMGVEDVPLPATVNFKPEGETEQ